MASVNPKDRAKHGLFVHANIRTGPMREELIPDMLASKGWKDFS
jgi:hypothetical protein